MSDELASVTVRYWIIRKSTRVGEGAYSGPSCAKAGVIPGCVYPDEASAQADADKLTAVNPVGFEAVLVERPLAQQFAESAARIRKRFPE